jgi:hypothetical protein
MLPGPVPTAWTVAQGDVNGQRCGVIVFSTPVTPGGACFYFTPEECGRIADRLTKVANAGQVILPT